MCAHKEADIASLLLEAGTAVAEWTDLSTGLERLLGIMLRAVPHTRSVVYRFDDRAESMQVVRSGR